MNEFDLAIVGGGPAGLAAAAYALHARLSVSLITPNLGGKVSHPFTLRDMPPRDTVWGASLVRELEMRVRNNLDHHVPTEVSQITQQEDGRFRIALSVGGTQTARALIVATGAQPQRLYIPGESEFLGRGLSFSAISHAPLFQERTVAVVGAGARAVDALLALLPLVRRAYLILARADEVQSMPGGEIALNHPKVVLFRNWEVQQIRGDDFVTGIGLIGANGESRALEVDGVFVQFGLIPANALVRDLVTLDPQGHIVINQHCETNVPGLFAAGDVTTVHAEQVPVSLGEGAKAALTAWRYLSSHPAA